MRQLIAIDIETDTSTIVIDGEEVGLGLDPRIGAIVSIAVKSRKGSRVWSVEDGTTEEDIIAGLADYLQSLEPSTLVSWNGSIFDFPFIETRARILGLNTGLECEADPDAVPKYEPTPGYEGGVKATWKAVGGTHDHIDAAYLLKDYCEENRVKWSLKPVAAHLGMNPVEVDREAIHLLTKEELEEYVLSDVNVTLQIAEKAISENLGKEKARKPAKGMQI